MPENSTPGVKQPHIVFDDVSFRYPMSRKYSLKHVSLTIFKGEFVAVLGENGAGKSTLCQSLNGVVPHSYGRRLYGKILVDGVDTQTVSVAELAQRVGIVLEDPETQLFTTSVLNEVAFGPENLGVEREEILDRVAWALRIVGLAGFEKTPPGSLSGGQKQRLAIAAALAMQPDVLVLDEATSQLDPMGVRQVFSVARELNQQHDMTIVMATDRGEEVAHFCDRVFVLHQGELIAQGVPREIFADETVLERARIAIPQVSQLATYLGCQGIPLTGFPITLEEARSEIINLMGGTN